jgi:transposase-like protein
MNEKDQTLRALRRAQENSRRRTEVLVAEYVLRGDRFVDIARRYQIPETTVRDRFRRAIRKALPMHMRSRYSELVTIDNARRERELLLRLLKEYAERL